MKFSANEKHLICSTVMITTYETHQSCWFATDIGKNFSELFFDRMNQILTFLKLCILNGLMIAFQMIERTFST